MTPNSGSSVRFPLAVALLLLACGGTKVPCNASTCGGCCDAAGFCQAGSLSNACGANGASCQNCGASLCSLGQCTFGATGGGTTATGGGTTATGGGTTATGGGTTATGGGTTATGGGTTSTGGGKATGGGAGTGGGKGTGGGGSSSGGGSGTGGGTAACIGDFSLGSTFNHGSSAYVDCAPANAPTNCATGRFIFGNGWCKCLLGCSDLTAMPKPGQACDSTLECRRLVSTSSGNTGNYCVPPNDSAWNFCFSNATGGGGGSSGTGGGTGGGGSSCAGSGKSCSFDDDCCSSNCEIGGVCQ